MKDVPKYILLLLLMMPLMSFWGAPAHAQAAPAVISDWQVLWEFEDREGDVNPASIRSRSQWIDAKKGMASPLGRMGLFRHGTGSRCRSCRRDNRLY
ncbi:hypothetical protein [Paenibacillus lactis]|uniref:hypothetical protein n=1 Tax=Paenibacillus lactis TaxID=228574 RepID=UPI003D70FCED